MDDFLDCIEALRQGEIGLVELCAEFEQLVARDPALAREALTALVDLSNQGCFPPQVVTMLEGRLPTTPQRARRAVDPAPAAPPVAPEEAYEDATMVIPAGAAPAAAARVVADGDASPSPSLPPGGRDTGTPPSVPTGDPSQPSLPTGGEGATAGPGTAVRATTDLSGSAWSDRFATTNLPGGGGEARIPEVGTVLRGRFELLQVLGRGGMGVVYKARDRSRAEVGYTHEEENYVAIKLLNEEFKRHPGSIRVFGREFRNTQKLKHPNIVNLYDFDRDEFGNYFIAMEMMAGEPLNRLVRRLQGKGMSFEDAFGLIEQMGSALAAAHGLASPIIHSDFKPGNVFIGPDNRIKVFDFGIARAARAAVGDPARGGAPDNASLDLAVVPGAGSGHESTTFVQGVGALTIAYASPEMLLGQGPEVRDDLYALAIVAYQLLTGERPFKDPKCSDIHAPACRSELLKARAEVPRRAPNLTGRQWKALQRGLAYDRNSRCRDIQAFIDELRVRPSRLPYAIAAGLVGAGVVGWSFGLAPYLEQREQTAREAAVQALLADIARAEPAALGPLPAAAAALPEDLRKRLATATIERLAAHVLSPEEAVRKAAAARLTELPEQTRAAVYERARAQLTEQLGAATPAAILPRLALLEALPPGQRAQIMVEFGEAIRNALIGASRAAFDEEANAYDFAAATAALDQAERLQPGMKVIDQEREALSARRRELGNTLNGRIDALKAVDKLLAAADFSADWASRTGDALIELAGLVGSGTALVDGVGTRLDRLFDARLTALLADNDFAAARQLLEQWPRLRGGDSEPQGQALAVASGLWSDNPSWRASPGAGTQGVSARPVPAGRESCNPKFAEYGNTKKARCADSIGGAGKSPELVVIPAGGGSAQPFAITRYEISVAEFNAYCAASGECNPIAAHNPKLPATGMSITQAEQYAAWLSRITGATYRLPTAGEWQFAATARGVSAGKDANCLLRSGGQIVKGGSADLVSTGVNNSWGLVNAIGNVQEWTRTGAAVQVHGGHYAEDASRCKVNWAAGHSGQGDAYTGFRLVKEIRG